MAGAWRMPAHADVRLPVEDAVPELHRARPLAGDQRRRSVVVWPFFGGGPMGKAPTELAGGDGVICQRRRLPSAA